MLHKVGRQCFLYAAGKPVGYIKFIISGKEMEKKIAPCQCDIAGTVTEEKPGALWDTSWE
jgi:hypothetical protein